MITNLVLTMKTTAEKAKVKVEFDLEKKRFESGNVLTASFWRSGE